VFLKWARILCMKRHYWCGNYNWCGSLEKSKRKL